MEKIYKPSEMATLLGVSLRTLQRWDKVGDLPARRYPSGRRYYTEAELKEARGSKKRRRKREGQ